MSWLDGILDTTKNFVKKLRDSTTIDDQLLNALDTTRNTAVDNFNSVSRGVSDNVNNFVNNLPKPPKIDTIISNTVKSKPFQDAYKFSEQADNFLFNQLPIVSTVNKSLDTAFKNIGYQAFKDDSIVQNYIKQNKDKNPFLTQFEKDPNRSDLQSYLQIAKPAVQVPLTIGKMGTTTLAGIVGAAGKVLENVSGGKDWNDDLIGGVNTGIDSAWIYAITNKATDGLLKGIGAINLTDDAIGNSINALKNLKPAERLTALKPIVSSIVKRSLTEAGLESVAVGSVNTVDYGGDLVNNIADQVVPNIIGNLIFDTGLRGTNIAWNSTPELRKNISNSVAKAVAETIQQIQANPTGGFIKPDEFPGADRLESIMPKVLGMKPGETVVPEKPVLQQFQGLEDLSTKVLETYLKGKTVVSKQFIQDLTKRQDITQAERDVLETALKSYPDGAKIEAKEFAEKVREQLLELTPEELMSPNWQNIRMPEDLDATDGNANYKETIYNAPFKTEAGGVHFRNEDAAKNYFGHVRSEDLDDDTRRILELQSDLFQRDRISNEFMDGATDTMFRNQLSLYSQYIRGGSDKSIDDLKKFIEERNIHGGYIPSLNDAISKLKKEQGYELDTDKKQLIENGIKELESVKKLMMEQKVPDEVENKYKKLAPYKEKWYQRMIREEVKSAAGDNKEALDFPTGKTAASIEGYIGSDYGIPLDTKPGDTFDYGGDSLILMDDTGNATPENNIRGTWDFDTVRDEDVNNEFDNLMYEIREGNVPFELEGDYDEKTLAKWVKDPDKYENDILDAASKLIDDKYTDAEGYVTYYNEEVTGDTGSFVNKDGDIVVLEDPSKVEMLSFNDNEATINNFDPNDLPDEQRRVYDFYEKDISSFLKKTYQGVEEYEDGRGLTWYRIPLKNQNNGVGAAPVQAFAGLVLGVEEEKDENGNVIGYKYSPQKGAALAVALMAVKAGGAKANNVDISYAKAFKKYAPAAKDLIEQEVLRLKEQLGGVLIVKTDDGYRRLSQNPPWYRELYKQYSRQPNQSQWRQLAEKNLREGGLDGFYEANGGAEAMQYNKAILDGTELPKDDLDAILEGTTKITQEEFESLSQGDPFFTDVKTATIDDTQQGGGKIPTADEIVNNTGGKKRKFYERVENDPGTPDEVKEQMKDNGFYEPIRNWDTNEEAKKIIADNPDTAFDRVMEPGIEPDAVNSAVAMQLVKKYMAEGSTDRALQILSKYSSDLTKYGQAVQAISMWSRLTPEGMLRFAQNIYRKANMNLTPDKAQEINVKMKAINEIQDEAKKADATQELMDSITQPIKPGFWDMLDTFRYNNMLSNPRTFMRNAFGNAQQALLLRPVELMVQAPLDYLKHTLRGTERQYMFTDSINYGKGTIIAVPQAIGDFWKTMRGQTLIEQPDMKDVIGGSTEEIVQRAKNKNMPFVISSFQRLNEATDKFFTALIRGGEMERGVYKNMEEGVANKMANDVAEKLLFRNRTDAKNKSGQGGILSGIDALTDFINRGRKFKPFSWFVPFVTTPMNFAKAWMEYSPVGFANIPGNKNKTEAFTKAAMGSTVSLIGAMMAAQGRTTWDAPTDAEEKKYFYATGRKPFSVKIGDNWVPMQYFGVFGLALALPAALRYQTEDSNEALSQSQMEAWGKAALTSLKFFTGQTYMEGLEQFVKVFSGDVDYSFASSTAFTAGQLIPYQGMVRYVATIIDPVYRKGTSFTDQIMKTVPVLSTGLTPIEEPTGELSKRDITSYIMPYDIGTQKDVFEGAYQSRIDERQVNKLTSDLGKEVDKQIENEIYGTGGGLSLDRFFGNNKVNTAGIKLDENSSKEKVDFAYKKANDIVDSYIKSGRSEEFKTKAGNVLSERLGIKWEDAEYNYYSKAETDTRKEWIDSQIENVDGTELLTKLLSFRKEGISSGSRVLSDNLVDELVSDGVISKDWAKKIKAIKWDDKTKSLYDSTKRGTGGSGSSKKIKIPTLPDLKIAPLKASSRSGVNFDFKPNLGIANLQTPAIPKANIPSLDKLDIKLPQQNSGISEAQRLISNMRGGGATAPGRNLKLSRSTYSRR